VLCRNAFDAVIRNSIIYFNYPAGISMNGTAPEITFSDVQDGIPGTGNMNADPLFIDLPGADFRLAQYATGTPFQSPCVDGGDGPAADAVVTEFGNRSPLADFTTRRDDVPDSGVVDMGYHYPAGPADWVPAAEIHMQSYYVEGHVFDIHLRLYNPGAAVEAVPVIFALEIDQAFYFWPHWMPAVEWLRLRIPSGITDLDLVKPMNWPVGWPAQNQPYRAWCAMLTDDMSAILGEMDMFEWWFGPEE